MRFSRLSLHCYGHFENCELAFPKTSPDIHLVFGTNEAGKSTTLSAACDLLFGFPHGKAYDFQFQAALLRVGGVLEAADRTLVLRRRRGERNTLDDGAGGDVPETDLQAMLQGRSAAEFRTKFCLDHARLREGGRTIIDAKGEVGQTLFAASSGVLTAQALQKSLQAEADTLWGLKMKTTYRAAAWDYEDARRRVRDATLRPRDWKTAVQAWEDLVAAQTALAAERAVLQAELATVARRRAVAAPAAQRAALLARIADLDAPAFDGAQIAAHDDITRAITAAELKLHAARASIAELEARRAGISIDPVILGAEEKIDGLIEEQGKIRAQSDDLPGIEAELSELGADAARLMRALDLQGDARLLESLPDGAAIAGLAGLVTQREGLLSRLGLARERWVRACDGLAGAEAELARHSAVAPDDAAAEALRQGRNCAAIAARLAERARAVQQASRARDLAMQRLAPWSGDAEALGRAVPPPEEDIRSAEAELAEASSAMRAHRAAAQAGRDELARLELELTEISAGGLAVSAAEIEGARGRRDAAWQPLRLHLAGGLQLPDAAACLAVYEAASTAADDLADERFATATASLRLRELGVQIAVTRLGIGQQMQSAAEAEAAHERAMAGWQARLSACLLPAVTPASARNWARDQAAAFDRNRAVQEAEAAEADDRAVVARSTERLLSVLADAGAGSPGDSEFAGLVEAVQKWADARDRAAAQWERLRASVEAGQDLVAAGAREIARIEADMAAWAGDWAAATVQARVIASPDEAAALLALFEPLRAALVATRKAQDRRAGIARDQARFAARAVALAADCGVVQSELEPHAITDHLRRLLRDTSRNAKAAEELEHTLALRRDEASAAERAIEAALAGLLPLMRMAGGADRAALSLAMQTAQSIAHARSEAARLEQEMIAAGEGHSLASLLAVPAADPSWLAQEQSRLQHEIGALDTRISAAAEGVGQARQRLDALECGPDATLAAADEAAARASLAMEAEAYVLKRSQVLMLKWAVDSYRKRQQSPLLTRAGTLFGRLTLARYAGLEIDHDCDKPRLVARTADGRRLVGVDAMSDGTADQLFLALRLAALEQSLAAGVVLPFLADDLFINFDDARAQAGFMVLGEIARLTQVIFFTHHAHLRDIARRALAPHEVAECELS